jgi:hypothetical protein
MEKSESVAAAGNQADIDGGDRRAAGWRRRRAAGWRRRRAAGWLAEARGGGGLANTGSSDGSVRLMTACPGRDI